MKKDTIIAHAGLGASDGGRLVNPAIHRGSTVVFPTLDAFDAAQADRHNTLVYGRMGTQTTFAFEQATATFEGGHRTVAVSSGLAAITVSLLAFLRSGDHILVSDAVYGPTRRFCDGFLARFGVETTYYDPRIGSGIAALLRDETRIVHTESPGSHTFEVQDIPAIAEAAHARGALVMFDNTWATPYFFRPFDHGVDLSVQAATKYIVGHADGMLGTVTTATDEHYVAVKRSAARLGNCPGPETCYLGLRGLRTLPVRLRQHQAGAMAVAEWLASRPEVARVMYPALPDDPGHALWARDFLGSSGLLGVVLDRNYERSALAAFIDGLKLFNLGASWGGFESLVLHYRPPVMRTATAWAEASPTLRFHVGLEDPDDLIDDLDRAFDRLSAAA